ncbi:MAG: rhamnulokinase [Actinobacteria bacterium]|nr:rhamnulokinase [Actinomycetota bacterium]
MASKNYLIFDFGASNGRGAVAKFDGKKFDMEIIHRFDNRPVYAADTLYWDILRLYSELKIGIQASVKKYSDIASMAIDTWGADFGFIDRNGKLISNPIHYRDEKRSSDADSLYEIISKEELFKLTGAMLLPIFDLFHLYSLKLQNAPEFINGDKFLTIPDIFNYFLTGRTYNEYTRITTSLMFNQKEKRWEDIIFDRLDIPNNIFPGIIMPGEIIGNISELVCRELEIRTTPVIAPVTHDTPSAVAGIPVADTRKNWAFISMGTWCIIGQETKSPMINKEIMDAGFSNEGGAEGLNLFIKNITGLWIIQQCRERWIKDCGKDISWDEIVNMSSNSKSFKSFIDVDEPSFSQPQVNMPEVIREYCKDKGSSIPENIGEISRCIYESLAMRFKHNLNLLEKITGKKVELLHLVGGGIQNKLLCQWTADATGVSVIAGPAETTSVGNLLMQLKAAGEIKNLEEGRKISLDSSKIIHYEPKDKSLWDGAYSRFIKLVR